MKHKHINSKKILLALFAATQLMSNDAQARRLVPESPSVEVRLEALRILQNSIQNELYSPPSSDGIVASAPLKSAPYKATPFKPAQFKPATNYTKPIAPSVVATTPVIPAKIIAKPEMVAPVKVAAKPIIAKPAIAQPAIVPLAIVPPVIIPSPVVEKKIVATPIIKQPQPPTIAKVIPPRVDMPKIDMVKVAEPLKEIAPIAIEKSAVTPALVDKKDLPKKIETPIIAPSLIEKTLPSMPAKLPDNKVLLPLEIIEEDSKKANKVIGEELSLDELLGEETPKPAKEITKLKKINAPEELKKSSKLPEPEIPALEPDFVDIASNIKDNNAPQIDEKLIGEPLINKDLQELPKNLEELENIKPIAPLTPPAIAAKTAKDPFHVPAPKNELTADLSVEKLPIADLPVTKLVDKNAPPVDMPLDLADIEEGSKSVPDVVKKSAIEPLISEKNTPKSPEKLPIQTTQQSPEKVGKIVENQAAKEGILPNLSTGFASFLGEPKAKKTAPIVPAEKSAKPNIAPPVDELPNLPTFNDAAPPVDGPLSSDNSAPEEGDLANEKLPTLPTFADNRAVQANNEPLPTLPFGEPVVEPEKIIPKVATPKLPVKKEQQIAMLPDEISKSTAISEPKIAQNNAVQNDKGNALTVVFSQSETEVPLGSQQPLIALAKQLVANNSENIKIIAYASGSNDQVSVARRISLARALAVRAFMIDLGVSNTSISVKAMGNDIPSGSPERADIIVN